MKEFEEGYYEYEVITLQDEDGRVNATKLKQYLNNMGKNGWRLKCVTTNELGKESKALGIGGFGGAVNSTIDETILILERFVYQETASLPPM